MNTLLLIVVCVTLFSCSPLRKLERTEQRERITLDKSISEKVEIELKKQIASINQMVIEYYPPKRLCTVDTLSTLTAPNAPKPQKSVVCLDSEDNLLLKKPPNQPVRSIKTTNIELTTDRITKTDSTKNANIVESVDSDYSEKIDEKPSNFVSTIKWLAILVGGILLTIIVIKLL